MAEQSSKPRSDIGNGDVHHTDSLIAEIGRMLPAFLASRERNRILMLAVALIAVVGATAYAQIRLSAWNQPFYNALMRKDMAAFIQQLGVFGEVAGILLVLNVAQMWLNQMSKVVLRRGLVHDLLNEWLVPLRAFRLSNSGWMGVNPDQRLQADAQHLTELTTDLGIGLLQATLLLASFIGVLWVLSQSMIVPFAGQTFRVPGYMVWCALFYAGTASFFSWLVGRPLIGLDAQRYAREAELRFALVRVSEEIEGITIYGGEGGEKKQLNEVFESVLDISRRIVGAVTRLTWVTAGYGWFTIIAPIVVAAPSYLSGRMSFGELMMVVGAFNQVQSSLRWFVDNFSNIADWRATLLRVASFRKAILDMDKLGWTASRISLDETEDKRISIDDLRVAGELGGLSLSEPHMDLEPKERVLIVGERGAGKTLLFRAIVGIWPWGRGRISRPAHQSIMFLPARAYIPLGTLRGVVAYPQPADTYEDATIVKALADVGLGRLRAQLDSTDRWDRILNEDEKQCLAFARVIVQKPQWVVLDTAFDVLDPVSRDRIKAVFQEQLTDVGLINIGRDRPEDSFFTRKLHLVADRKGPSFRPANRHRSIAQQ